jgi:hypothetical protein
MFLEISNKCQVVLFTNIQVDKNSSDKIEVNNDVMIPIKCSP